MVTKYLSHSEQDTLEFAGELGKNAQPGTIFALFGELGSGKTILAKGIALGLGVAEEITSPTFTLLEIYTGRVPLYHFDLYRIESKDELDRLFFEEYWEDDGVCIIEWADKAEGRLPEGYIAITIEYLDETRRNIIVEYPRN
jgi:tRNA threonylcarbamoyladenosine biosynthesis protein TsaE